MRRRTTALAAGCLVLAGCATPAALSSTDGRLQVVTTTGILRDLVEHVGGERVQVTSLVPDGGDPHTYEPSLRDVRNVVYADVAFSNYAMLEEHNVIRTLDANLDEEASNVSLAEESVKYAAELIPLVEDVTLDTVWLGLRATGSPDDEAVDRSSEVVLSATGATGPGALYGYLTGTFGDTDRYFDSSDGFDAADGFRDDSVGLPLDAHTHMSWAFTEPGVYTLDLSAQLRVSDTARPEPLGEATYTFAVGVSPDEAGITDATVLDEGHADLTVDVGTGELAVLFDPSGGGEGVQERYAAASTVIEVPNSSLSEVPAGQEYRFLGRAGEQVFQLPQAVLGKHVHGEIDPHLWQDVGNAMAYAELIRDTLVAADPAGALDYRRNTEAYLDELEETDRYVRDTIAAIPEGRRQLVTTHDAFGYLHHAYAIDIAGFVTPNPASEPSLAARRKLTETIRNLGVPAVFLEPNLAARSATLTEVADDVGIAVCPIYGDTFDDTVTDYVSMMRFNADSLHRCLS